MKHKIIEKNPAGFSLVELSFVVLIIGLLIAVTTGGKKLITLSNFTKARTMTSSAPLTSIDNLALWMETTTKNSFTTAQPTDGTLIDTWKDINTQAPIKKDVTAAGAARPTYTENAINGLPALSFDGTANAFSRTTLGYELSKSNEVTIFVVLKTLSPPQNSGVLSWYDGSSAQLNIHAPWSDNNIYWDFGATCCGTDVRITTAAPAGFLNSANILSTIKRADNTGDIAINNNIIASSNTLTAILSTQSSGTFYIGRTFNGSFQKGYISEIIIYDRALSTSERQRVTEYLSKKWNITIS